MPEEKVKQPELEVETPAEGVKVIRPQARVMQAEVREFAIELIKKIRLALSKYRLYPPGSKLVSDAFDELYSRLSEFFSKEQMITISEAKGDLLINGRELSVSEAGRAVSADFAFLLANQGIKSFSFRRGIKKEEISIFIDCLSKSKEHFRDHGGLISYLKEKGTAHIVVNETIYVAVVKGDLIIQKASDLLVQAGGKIDAVVRTMEETAEMLKTVPDHATHDAIVMSLAKKMGNFDPPLLKELMERPLPTDVRETGIKENILSALSSEKVEECFNSIVGWYGDIKKKELPPEEREEEVGKLKLFLDQLLATGAAKGVPVHAYENLVKSGVLTQIPPGIEGPSMRRAEVAPVAYTTALLEKREAVAFLEAATREELPGVVNLLCLMDRDDLISKLLSRVAENIRSPLKRIRLQTVKFLKSLIQTINSAGKAHLLTEVENIFENQLETETDQVICTEYADCLRDKAGEWLMNGEYEKSAHLAGLFKRLSSPETGVALEKREIAAASLKAFTEKAIDVLIADLKSGDAKRQARASQTILRLTPTVVPSLVRIIEESEDLRVRRMVASVLSRLGAEAKDELLGELRVDTPVEVMKKIITVVDEFGNGDLLARLSNTVSALDPQVRREYVRLLRRVDTDQKKALLVKQLQDPDFSVRSEVVRFIGELKLTEGVEPLSGLLAVKNDSFQQEVCAALGKIQDEKAVPVLARLLKKPGFFSFRKTPSPQVRAAAIWALSKFSTPEAGETIQKAARDKSTFVQTVVHQVLQLKKAS